MRGLFWLLLLANIAVVFWVRWDTPPLPRPDPPIAAATLTPLSRVPLERLHLRAPVLAAAPSAAGTSLAASVPPAPPAPPSPSAPVAVAPPLRAPALAPVPQSGPLSCFAGTIPAAARAAARAQLGALGVPYRAPVRIYLVVSPTVTRDGYQRLAQQAVRLQLAHAPTPHGNRLSYGLFRERAHAEHTLQQLSALHVVAEIKPERAAGPWILGPMPLALVAPLGRRLHAVLKSHRCPS